MQSDSGTVAGRTASRDGTATAWSADELLRAISDASTDVIFVKNRAGRLRFANPAALAFIGKPLDVVLGRTDMELLAHRHAARESWRTTAQSWRAASRPSP